MIILFFLLCLYALLGSVDVVYFHIYKFKLYEKPSSRSEHLTHLSRALIFLCVVLWVLLVRTKGIYSLILPALLIFDLVNSLIDVYLEPKSRISLGGLPPLEYLVHMLSMFTSGAIFALSIMESAKVFQQNPELSFHVLGMPQQFVIQGVATAFITLLLFLFEGFQFVRHLTAKKGVS